MDHRGARPIWAFLTGPYAVLLLVLLLAPFANIAMYSLHPYSPTKVFLPELTFDNYRKIFDLYYVRLFGRTLQLGLITTAVCVVLGHPLADRDRTAGLDFQARFEAPLCWCPARPAARVRRPARADRSPAAAAQPHHDRSTTAVAPPSCNDRNHGIFIHSPRRQPSSAERRKRHLVRQRPAAGFAIHSRPSSPRRRMAGIRLGDSTTFAGFPERLGVIFLCTVCPSR